MPDQFKIEQYNGSHYVRGIASDKSKHVSSLVARQKRPTNARNPPRFLPPHLRQSSSSTFNRHPQHTRHQPVIISHDKLLLLVQYIQSNPNGVGMDRAVKFAQKLVPYTNLSEQDLRAQLRELPHQVHLQGSMVYPAQNNDLQDSAAYSQPMKVPVREEPQSWNKPESSSDVASPLNAQNVFVAGEEDQDWIECSSDENDFIPAGCNPGSNYKKRVKTSELLETNIAQHMKYEQTDMYKLKNNLENGDDMYKAKNDLEDDDYSITINSSKSNTGTKDIKLLDLSEIISDRTKLRLEKLLEKHPDGIWCADLPDIYLNEYKVPLSYTDLGFTSVREFTSHLPKIFYMTQVHKTSDFLLYSADKRPVVPKTDSIDIAQASNTHTLHNKYDEHSSDMQAHCRNAEDDPIPSEVSPTITRKFAPNDVMNYGDKVGKISVTELQQITLQHKTFLEVYVCEVFNPSFFWIHLRKNKIQFQKLMSDIHDFYSDESNQSSYTIAKIALKKDLNCACIYLNNWHRGIIKSVKPDFRITVFFYDFGTLKTYAPEEVFYLHKKFAYLPAQAIPCSLYNVKPIVGDRWKKSVCGQFIDKISESLLVASIISVDAVNNSMVVVLTDTTEEEDVRINNWLVNERLAQVGQMADAVDMASIMKYVVNISNQLPTYCFAEESLMPDNCYKATSTEEKHEVPLVPPGSTTSVHHDNQQQPMRPPTMPVHHDNQYQQQPMRPAATPVHHDNQYQQQPMRPAATPVHHDNQYQQQPMRPAATPVHHDNQYQQQPMRPAATPVHHDNQYQQQPTRPPPGFSPLGEQRIPSDASPKNSQNGCCFASASNASDVSSTRMSIFDDAEAMTNPFLADEQYMPNDLIKQFNMSIWNDSKMLQSELTDILCDLLEHTSLSILNQMELNKILRIIKKVLLTRKESYSAEKAKASSTSNLASGMASNDAGSAQKAFNFNSETAANREFNANTFPTLNPFNTNGPSTQSNAFSPQNSSDGFTFRSNWSQSDDLGSRMPMPPSAATTSVPSAFINHTSSANTFLPKASQNGENVPLATPISPTPTNTNIPNNLSEYLDSVNAQFANMLKDTNPFKPPVTNATQVPEMQNERTAGSYDAGIARSSYHPTQNPQGTLQTETTNMHARSNCFTPAGNQGHVSENYTPRMVYESGPVMYNTQKKQAADASVRQNACSSNNVQNAQKPFEFGQSIGKRPASRVSQPVSATPQHKMMSNKMMRDSLPIDETYARPSAYYAQSSQPVVNGDSNYYQQNSNADNLRPAPSQGWRQVDASEHWTDSKFQNSVPSSSHSESSTFVKSTSLPHQDWNCDKSVPREMNKATDLSNAFNVKEDRDKERLMDICTNSWYNTENGSIQKRNPFVFQKIDSVKGVTFIFNFEQDGWMLTSEFVDTFTNFKLYSRLLATVEILNIKVVFKEILRSEYPEQFLQLDRFPLNVPRDSERRIISISLISLQSAIGLLHKLKIISREEIDNAFKMNEFSDGSVLRTLWTLIVSYRDLKRHIELCSN
ncbi:PREDICTED: uncharacterized protein LOC105450087 isoform X2 [Wasmannia auropunctata]|nr:PREDICTED: uncharacterized protein LOC105450087 isoform X2 [Wasmannia auropunctata]XP_011688039.1 PREDICTED: uncharacterized protein LOC105450087 isoform X2 [Wasmannia auropunctata]